MRGKIWNLYPGQYQKSGIVGNEVGVLQVLFDDHDIQQQSSCYI
ncbi:MAG: hypothetical protein ACYDIA_04365 [Candidatus Humimicrobiaceae bacterium]